MCIFTKKFRTLDPHPPIVQDFFLKKIVFFWMPSLTLAFLPSSHTCEPSQNGRRPLHPSIWSCKECPRPPPPLPRFPLNKTSCGGSFIVLEKLRVCKIHFQKIHLRKIHSRQINVQKKSTSENTLLKNILLKNALTMSAVYCGQK